MDFATMSKIFLLLTWPLLFLLFMYFKDKEKFKQRLRRFKWKDW